MSAGDGSRIRAASQGLDSRRALLHLQMGRMMKSPHLYPSQKDKLPIFLLSLTYFLLHIVTGWQYGYFRDELYFLSMSEHLDFGYVDVPPIVPLLMRLSRAVLGDSVFALHVLPAIAGALTVFLGGLIAKRLGGGSYAMTLTSVTLMSAPMFYAYSSLFTYNCFDQLMSCLFIYILAGILAHGGTPNRIFPWVLLGLCSGIGVMVKLTFLFVGFGFAAALLMVDHRRLYVSRRFWTAALISLVVSLPYLFWQMRHDFITWEYLSSYSQFKTSSVTVFDFSLTQILALNFVSAPLWLAGLYSLFAQKQLRFRLLGWMAVILFILVIGLDGKYYMTAACYYAPLAAGAVIAEKWFTATGMRAAQYSYMAGLFVVGLILLPMSVPVLAPSQYLATYSHVEAGIARLIRTDTLSATGLPHHFADRFGWEELAQTVAHVYRSLPAQDQAQCAILAANYGEAAAIDFFGAKYNLPKAISGHLSYYTWGYRSYSGDVVLAVGFPEYSRTQFELLFEDVSIAAYCRSQYARSIENDIPVFLCKRSRAPLGQLWPRLENLR